jgi:hypothetical protein
MGRYSISRKRQGGRGRLLLAAMLCVGLLAPGSAHADAPPWHPVDAQTGRLTAIADLEALKAQFPDSASVRRRLLNAYLDAGRQADAADEAVELVDRGYVFSPAAQEMIQGLGVTDAQLAVLALQEVKAEPIETSRVLATLPADVLLVEGAALDRASGRLFASSIVSKSLQEIGSDGALRHVELDKPGSLAGMAFDEVRRTLWVASGIYAETPDPGTGARGIFGVDLRSGETFRKATPEGATPGDIAIGPDGRLYASDALSGAIYSSSREIWQLWPLVEPGTFRSPQGIVPWDGGLIVSDYAYGLAFVDRAGKAWRMEADQPMILDGIDGMWRRGDTIVAVQNGMRPPRIVALAMARDGRRVTGLRVLERAHRAWTEPVGGSLAGDELIYVGTGQWDRFGEGGEQVPERPPVPTEIRALPLRD